MKRSFILGDQWLYYKIYCGKRTADMILVDAIKPLTEALLINKLIDKWFFIRYSDPDPHLRIRFHCNNINKLGAIIENVNKSISNYVENDLIWKIQTDTYNRELERYGKNSIEETESLFFYDSTASIEALSLIQDDELLFLFMLKSIDNLLTSFNYDLKDKIELTKKNLDYFREEFNADKYLSKQLYKKHQKLKPEFESFITVPISENYKVLFNIMEDKNQKIEPIKNYLLELHKTKKLEVSLYNLLSDYIHMMVNKQFRDKKRLFELLCYDFLYRHYNSILANKNKK